MVDTLGPVGELEGLGTKGVEILLPEVQLLGTKKSYCGSSLHSQKLRFLYNLIQMM